MANVTVSQLNSITKAIEMKTLFTQGDVELNIANLSKIENCDKFSFTDFMNILTLKGATVTLSTTLDSLIYKQGLTIYGGTTLSAVVTKGSYDIEKVEFFIDNGLVSTENTDVADGGNYTYAYGTDITTNKVFKVVVTDVEGNVVQDSVSLNFYNPYYFGKTNKEIVDVTEVDILAMTQVVNKKDNQKHKYTMSDERAVFVYDKTYGDLTSILDISSFENRDSFVKSEMIVNGVVCNVYILDSKCYCTDFEYTFKF